MRLQAGEIAYTVHKSARRRRTISLSFEAEKGLRVLAPIRTKPETIHRLLHDRLTWIERRAAALAGFEPLLPEKEFADGAAIPFLGKKIQVQAMIGKPAFALEGDELRVSVKSDAPTLLRKQVLEWYKAEARKVIFPRLEEWAEKIGVKYRNVYLSNARRLWGSCSARNDIRINWRIIMAPLPVLDCLLVHELCHVIHKNHSHRFWRLMDKHLPDHRACRQQMRLLEGELLRRGR